MFEVQLIDPNGYDVPFAHLPIATLAKEPTAQHTLLTVQAPKHAAASGVGYDAREYTTRTRTGLLPTDPQNLAHVVATGQPSLLARLTAQFGARPARLLLADAYTIHAATLRAAA